MPGALDYAKLIPVLFGEGEVLTAESLNRLQRELLKRVLEHTHAGNDLATPQGLPLKRDGIDAEEIFGTHIHDGVLKSRHFESGAVDSAAIGNQQVLERHLAANAVGDAALKAGAVTREKLAPELAALLDSLGGAASTFGYFAFLDGLISYPNASGNWYDWMIKPEMDVPASAIYRLAEGGNWQPTKAAGLVRETAPPLSWNFAASDAGVTVRAAYSQPASGTRARVAAAQPAASLAAIGALDTALMKSGLAGDYMLAQWGQLPSDHLERKQIKIDIETVKAPGLVPLSGKVTLNPGVGGTEPFRKDGAIDFLVPVNQRTYEHWAVARRIAYHLGIDENALLNETKPPKDSDALLTRLYEVMQHPERVLAGYWTGPTLNVRSAVRIKDADAEFVRITFAVPYTTQAYSTQVTVDYSGKKGLLVPTVMRRQKEYVDIAFWNGTAYINRSHFSLSVVGELSVS